MRFGPCGGTTVDGRCEVDERGCPFVDVPAWAAAPPTATAVPFGGDLGEPVLVVDVRAPQRWSGDAARLWADFAAALAGCAPLLGEHVDNPQRGDDAGALDPVEVIGVLAAGGAAPIATITGRDRTLADVASLVAAYRAAGARAIHAVTGDHPAALGLDRAVTFGTESLEIVAAAAAAGSPVTVGESPASPGDRVARVLAKEAAGASVCVLNHGGEVADLAGFVDRCRAAGATSAFVAPVPMIADARSAGALARFPGLRLPSGYLDAIVAATEPYDEAVSRAAALVAEVADSGRFAGINLSGSARDADPRQRLRSTAAFVDVTRRAWAAAFSG